MLKAAALDVSQIHPLTDFLRNAKSHIARLKESGGPEVLTVNGRAEIVVQDAAAYQILLEKVERADLIASLREALSQAQNGETISLDSLEAELNEIYGV